MDFWSADFGVCPFEEQKSNLYTVTDGDPETSGTTVNHPRVLPGAQLQTEAHSYLNRKLEWGCSVTFV